MVLISSWSLLPESINIEQSRTAVGVRAAAASLPLDQVWGLCVCVYSSTPDRFISPRGGSYWFLQDLSIGAISEATNDVFLFCVVGSWPRLSSLRRRCQRDTQTAIVGTKEKGGAKKGEPQKKLLLGIITSHRREQWPSPYARDYIWIFFLHTFVIPRASSYFWLWPMPHHHPTKRRVVKWRRNPPHAIRLKFFSNWSIFAPSAPPWSRQQFSCSSCWKHCSVFFFSLFPPFSYSCHQNVFFFYFRTLKPEPSASIDNFPLRLV